MEGALRLLASGEALEQMLQVCEQDMDATDEAVSDLKGVGLSSGKRKREEELDDQPVRHSLWEQGSLEACNERLFGYLDREVEALQQRKAVYDEERRLSEGSDSCWSGAYSDSDSAAELEVNTEPIALEGAVVAVIQGGEGEGAAGEQAGKRKRRHKLAQQPVRHSLWEQDSLEAQNEVLAGLLEGEVRALKQRKADYDEARRQSDGSDSCWSGADSDSDSAAELEVVSEPPALEGAAAEQGEVEPLRPRGLAPKRLRDRTIEQDGRGKQQQKRKGSGKEGAGKKQQGDGKWSMPGFRVDPGGAELVAGRYTVKAVQSQVSLQGAAGRETWLGVDLLRGGGRTKFTGWMHSGELQRRAAGDADWLARLRGRGREGWSVEDHSWVGSGGPAVTGHGLRGAVVGWYLPVLVVDEEQMKRVGGVRVVVLMKRVAVGRTAGGVEQAVGIRVQARMVHSTR